MRIQVFDFSTQTPISPICRTPLFPISQDLILFFGSLDEFSAALGEQSTGARKRLMGKTCALRNLSAHVQQLARQNGLLGEDEQTD